jgi:hypothetical protein
MSPRRLGKQRNAAYIELTTRVRLESAMHSPNPVSNPFALLLNPEAVLAALGSSERLGRLNSRICRPLDRSTAQADASEPSSSDDGTDTTGERES